MNKPNRNPEPLIRWLKTNAAALEQSDLRFGQVLANAVTSAKSSLFYVENDELVRILDKYMSDIYWRDL